MKMKSLHAKEKKLVLQNLVKGLSYEWSVEPEEQFPDEGNQLTDGKYGSLDYKDPAWVGHYLGKTRAVIFDLGKKQTIVKVQANFLQDHSAGIAFPNTVSVYVSDDKKQWGILGHLHTKKGRWTQEPPSHQTYVWYGEKDGIWNGDPNATMAYARYVKVTFTMEGWVFLDEIEIWGYDGYQNGAVSVPPNELKYIKAGEATGGIHNLVLLYNGHYDSGAGDWKKDDILPYITYVNQEGEPQDWFFDGVLYLGLLTPQKRSFEIGTATLDEWKWYLDKTFRSDGEMVQLNEAVSEAKEKLDNPDHKVKVVIMIPYTGDTLTDFGDVDGDGVSENFNSSIIGPEAAYENKWKAVRWWMDQVKQRWQQGHYTHLEWVGMYWLSEEVGLSDPLEPELIRNTSKLVHEQGLKFFWIPYFQGKRNFAWKTLGFDAAILQPNHFFPEESDPIRLEDTAELAQIYQMGVEIEIDERVNRIPNRKVRYLDYLNGGIDYGYMKDVFKGYYQGNRALLESARSHDLNIREHYDWMYQFVKGIYQKK